MTQLKDLFEEFLRGAILGAPGTRIFRAGGWDYGTTPADLTTYVSGLRRAGLDADSSACRGVFGSASWCIGLPYGRNCFSLPQGLLEVAPTLPMGCGWYSGIRTRAWEQFLYLRAACDTLRQRGGLAVLVVHFDHLFHSYSSTGQPEMFAISDAATIRARIETLFRRVARWQMLTRSRPTTLCEWLGFARPSTRG